MIAAPVTISVVLMALALGAVLLVFRKQRAKRKDAIVSFLLTMTGTFVGVYFAVFMADSHSATSEKEQLTVMLHQAIDELDHQHSLTESVLAVIEEQQRPSEKKHYPPINPINPIRELRSFNQLLAAPLCFKHLQPFYADLLVAQHNIGAGVEQSRSEKSKTELSQQAVDERVYRAELSNTRTLLLLAIDYLENRVSLRDLQGRITQWRANIRDDSGDLYFEKRAAN